VAANELGAFANHFAVGCTAEEIVIRFGIFFEDFDPPTIHWTVITTPGYARQLIGMLEDALRTQAALAARDQVDSDGTPPETLQ
jgi:hypothetical protein